MGSPWYDCANGVRARAGWRCECPGTCGDHTDRCEGKQGKPLARRVFPRFPADAVRLFAVHRTDLDCATPTPGGCQEPTHYTALCHFCRRDLADAAVAVERRAALRARRQARLQGA